MRQRNIKTINPNERRIMKYTARWSANNNSTYGSFEGNNLKTMKKDAREIATGNTFAGSTGSWSIVRNDDPNYMPVASGSVKN